MSIRHLPDVMLISFCEQEELEAPSNPNSAAAPPLPTVGCARSLGCVDAVRKDVLD